MRLYAITSIIGKCYSINNLEETRKRIQQGLDLINSDNRSKYLAFYYEILCHLYLIDERNEEFEELMVNKFIPYLKDTKTTPN